MSVFGEVDTVGKNMFRRHLLHIDASSNDAVGVRASGMVNPKTERNVIFERARAPIMASSRERVLKWAVF